MGKVVLFLTALLVVSCELRTDRKEDTGVNFHEFSSSKKEMSLERFVSSDIGKDVTGSIVFFNLTDVVCDECFQPLLTNYQKLLVKNNERIIIVSNDSLILESFLKFQHVESYYSSIKDQKENNVFHTFPYEYIVNQGKILESSRLTGVLLIDRLEEQIPEEL